MPTRRVFGALLAGLVAACDAAPGTPSDAGVDASIHRDVPACEAYFARESRCLEGLPAAERERLAVVAEERKRTFRAVQRNLATESAREGLAKACADAEAEVRARCPGTR